MAASLQIKKEEKLTSFYAILGQFEQQTGHPDLVSQSVDMFGKLIELFIWGEKNEQIFSDVFIEKNMLRYFLVLLSDSSKAPNAKDNVIKLMKCYSFFILNVKHAETINYVYSHSNFNNFLRFAFDFKDEEIVFYYTNFIKSLTQKFESFPFQIFYNKVD
jgi:hypothetical protein